MTLRKGESPGFYGTLSTSTFRFVRTSCPTKTLWSFKPPYMALKSTRHPSWSEKLRATGYEDSGLVFPTGKGTPLDAQNIINRLFKPLLKRAGLRDVRCHDLRHTYATLLLSRGSTPRMSRNPWGTPAYNSPSTVIPTGCRRMGRNTAEGINEALG